MAGTMTKTQLKDFINDVLKEAIGTTLDEQIKETEKRQNKFLDTFLEKVGSRGDKPAEREKGLLATAFIRCQAAAAMAFKSGRPLDIEKHAKKVYGEDVAKALSASTLTEGGVLVPEQVAADIIPLLRPASVIYASNPRIVEMPSGVYSQPKLANGATASYIGENQNLPKTEPGFGAVRLTAKKLGALVPLSNDWVRRENAGGDSAVRDDLVAAVAQRGDLAFLRGVGSQFSPRGLRYLAKAANVFGANATVNLANVTNDLGQMVLRLANANIPMTRPGWVSAPRTWNYLMTVRDANGNFAFRDELMQGRLWGWPFKMTTQIPVNLGGGTDESELFLADFAEVLVGETTQLLIDTSSEAAYHDGSQLQAAFSLDQTLIRVIVEHDMGLRQDDAVVVMHTVKWS